MSSWATIENWKNCGARSHNVLAWNPGAEGVASATYHHPHHRLAEARGPPAPARNSLDRDITIATNQLRRCRRNQKTILAGSARMIGPFCFISRDLLTRTSLARYRSGPRESRLKTIAWSTKYGVVEGIYLHVDGTYWIPRTRRGALTWYENLMCYSLDVSFI